GHAPAVDRAISKSKDRGAKRALPLPVSAPFHCSLMAPVQPRLAEVLASIQLKQPSAPIVANVTAEPNSDPARIVRLLLTQVTARKGVKGSGTRTLGCAAGLECVAESGAQVASAAEDAGPRKARTCQWKSFGDCDVSDSPDGGATPASAQGGQQCLAGYKCRDGKCTVMCVGNKDCRDG